MNDTAELARIRITRAGPSKPILISHERDLVSVRAGTVIEIDGKSHTFSIDTPAMMCGLTPGQDYGLSLTEAGGLYVEPADKTNPLGAGYIAGFHYAPAGNATGASGGDPEPAINACSLWDLDFRPSCPDPRGMALVDVSGRSVWVDIYLLGVDHHDQGTSRCGAEIADGSDLPQAADGKGKAKKLDYPTTVEIYASHGKRLVAAEEFFAAAYGVKERCSRDDQPTRTGTLDDNAARFISRFGLFDATGTMWQWGTDGHPIDARPSLFGGSWIPGGDAGSRYALLANWPGSSYVIISARGACDHLMPV